MAQIYRTLPQRTANTRPVRSSDSMSTCRAQQSDRQLLDFLSATGRDVLVVATKEQSIELCPVLGQQYPSATLLPYSSRRARERGTLENDGQFAQQASAEAPYHPSAFFSGAAPLSAPVSAGNIPPIEIAECELYGSKNPPKVFPT